MWTLKESQHGNCGSGLNQSVPKNTLLPIGVIAPMRGCAFREVACSSEPSFEDTVATRVTEKYVEASHRARGHQHAGAGNRCGNTEAGDAGRRPSND